MNEAPDYPKEVNEIYRGRRDALIDGLGRIGWHIEQPKGTMFVWAPIPEPYAELAQPRVRQDAACRRPRSRCRPASASAPAARASCASRSSRTSSASARPSAASAAPSPSSAEAVGRRAAILLVVAVALGVSAPAAGAQAAAPPPAGVHSLGPVPAGVRPTVLVHAGNQVLVFGVDGKAARPSRNVGAVYSVARDQWRAMARAPFDPVVALPAGVWTGRELVVVGLACAPHQYDDEGSCRRGTYRGAAYPVPSFRRGVAP